MKLKLDENVDIRVVTLLRLAGHDVTTVPEQKRKALKMPEDYSGWQPLIGILRKGIFIALTAVLFQFLQGVYSTINYINFKYFTFTTVLAIALYAS